MRRRRTRSRSSTLSFMIDRLTTAASSLSIMPASLVLLAISGAAMATAVLPSHTVLATGHGGGTGRVRDGSYGGADLVQPIPYHESDATPRTDPWSGRRVLTQGTVHDPPYLTQPPDLS